MLLLRASLRATGMYEEDLASRTSEAKSSWFSPTQLLTVNNVVSDAYWDSRSCAEQGARMRYAPKIDRREVVIGHQGSNTSCFILPARFSFAIRPCDTVMIDDGVQLANS
ncbi:hypothetical protein CV102_09280 [Natronococcus pandeyae]|uniref:Uncharacterized protein n=1 Tax=Natronococcus pandeyae TaxID=2055836 RepID=A0A8J8Q7H7_9EURY|nr:hypothetical protein CV102_09280 [Natronococcus pandeyae]